jgi:hypothetical protein
MPEARWKRIERQTARLLGAQRLPSSGRPAPDILAGPFCIEHKVRKRLPAWLLQALAQARQTAGPGQIPLVVLAAAPGPGRPIQRLALLALDDLLHLLNSPQATAYDQTTARPNGT